MSTPDSPKFRAELLQLELYSSNRDLKKAAAKVVDLESAYPNLSHNSPRFLLLKATLFNQTGDYMEAISTASKAYDLVRDTSDHELLALVQTELARASQYLGDTDRSEREYRDVAATYRRCGNTLGIIDTLNKIAGIRYLRADYDEACSLLGEAGRCAEELGDELRLARISGNLGRIAIRQGKFHDAVDKLSVSIEKHGKLGNHVSLARSFLSLALVEIRLANFDSARRNLKKALLIIREQTLRRELAIYFEYKGELLLAQGNLDKALSAANNAIEAGSAVAAEGDLLSQSERLKGQILFKLRRIDEAEESANKALHVAERIDEKLEIAESVKLLAEISDAKRCETDSKQQLEYSVALLRSLGTIYELADCFRRACELSWVDVSAKAHYQQTAIELYSTIGLDLDMFRKPEAIEAAPQNRHIYIVTGATGESVRIATANRQMRSILRVVNHCKDSDIPILITGETGTGKDLLAKYIHHSSIRSGGPFIPVNCSAIPKDLAESELFGHVKGSFTNAVEDKQGLVSAADGGTLFLNEIGELQKSLQAKLLGCLEEKRVARIGDTVAHPVNFRLITATNRDLEEDVSEGAFRQDLYFRIAVMTLELPPLRQRGEDLVELIKFFLCENGIRLGDVNGIFDHQSIPNILGYGWPGNIRELRNEIQLCALEYPGDPVGVVTSLEARLSKPIDSKGIESASGLSRQLAEFERNRIREALKLTDGVIRRAAQILQIPEATLRSKMRRHDM
ncbi:MAG: sigma 54-interacting transcriptional regulator [candidate division Zixibacteria bacterium]|nr:sigma 54-interacting transcriptional regulator [candidate division Zixibacteria bacterium]MBU2624561.1 sigma 54-interacting transcriptional regulator [candidate division Zixibacteria bacterium]